MLRLSSIVPFSNVEPYIEECIRSLYNQDILWEEYEVICIDDCSPDGSRVIVERLQQEYPTLKLLRTPENLRQGGARKMGLDIAQGKYIWFVDSDDYIKANCLGNLLQKAEDEHLDILDFDFDADYSKQKFVKNVQSFDKGPCSGADYVFCANYGGNWSWRCVCVWGGIIRYELIKDMRFREYVQYEDNDFALQMYARAQRVHHIVDKPYFYRVAENSTIHTHWELRHVIYDIALIKRYITMLREDKWEDKRWKHGVRELLNYSARQAYLKLKECSIEERHKFYRCHLGYIPYSWRWMYRRLWLKLLIPIG